MLAIALNYADDISKPYDSLLIDEMSPRIGGPNDRIIYKELCEINIIKKLDVFIEGLCNLICDYREIKTEII